MQHPSQFFSDKLCDDDIALVFTNAKNFTANIEAKAGATAVDFAKMMGFAGNAAQTLLLPSQSATDRFAFVGVEDKITYQFGGSLVKNLPKGNHYHISDAESLDTEFLYNIALGWGLEQYRNDDYKSDKKNKYSVLYLPPQIDTKKLLAQLHAIFLTRHMINLPANDMNPESLQAQAEKIAATYNCDFNAIIGDDLLTQNFPLIHAVGRASIYEPRLLEINHTPEQAKMSLTLVGKGVCFDSGGLDLKPSSNMLLMKKDMGGAAHALGLAQLILETGLPIRLRVLIPAVENAISSNSFRPMDILTSRSGKSIEVGNTDAEGRLILADTLTYACEAEKLDLLIDFATLTGAARVAVGTEIAAMFSNHHQTATALLHESLFCEESLWQLPLHVGYRDLLDSSLADISSTGSSGFAGAITAALFLQEFVASEVNWVHFDIMAWNLRSRAAHPIGGEAMCFRTIYGYLQNLMKG